MADQVTVDNGSLTDYVVSADDAGAAGHVQRVKVAYSADGVATHVTADADGLQVNLGANNDVTVTGTVELGAASLAAVESITAVGPLTDAQLRAVAVPVSGTITVTEPVSVDDNGSSLTVDGTVAATQSGAWNVTNVSGTVSLPTGASTLAEQQSQTTALQLIDNLVTLEDAAHANADPGIVPLAVRRDTATSSTATDGDYATLTTDTAGRLRVTSADLTQPVSAATLPLPSGASTSAKQDTEITALAAIQTAVEILDNTVAGSELQVDVLTMPVVAVTQSGTWDEIGINDSGNSITVDGSVTANAGTNLNTSALALEAGGNLAAAVTALQVIDNIVSGSEAQVDIVAALPAGTNNIGDVDVLSSALPTGASTLAEQQFQTTLLGTIDADTGSIMTAVQLLDDTVAVLGTDAYTEATTKGLTVGAVRRDADTTLVNTTNEIGPLQMDANGRLKVEAFSGETLPVSLTSTTVTGTVAVTQSGTWDEVGINDSGNSITVDGTVTVGTMAALVAGNANIGDVDVASIAAGDNNIGNVDVVTLPNVTIGTMAALVAGSAAIGKLAANSGVDIGDVDVLTLPGVAGDIAHDSADSGNPVKVGAKAATALPTAVATNDRTNNISDVFGRQLTGHIDAAMQTSKAFNATTTQTGIDVWDPAAGKKIAVTSVVIGTYGTTAGRLILWFGDNADTTYSAGTDQLLLAASFAPTASSKPGLVFTPAVPIFCNTADYELHVTTDANLSVDIVCHGYEF